MDQKTMVPFETVTKDGFMSLECAKDYLFNHGDKFGDGKDSYKEEHVTNVSIVHYTDIVAKEDRKSMTHEVCFEFCRTVPDMLVFGITNGRDCYCAPYLYRMEGDNSDCDEVCDGEPTQVCGSKTKSSIFEMHSCDDTKQVVEAAVAKAKPILASATTEFAAVKQMATDMEASADATMASLGEAGDPAAADLMMSAKQFAGKMLHAVEKGEKVATTLQDNVTEAEGLGDDFTTLEDVNTAEGLVKTIKDYIPKVEDELEEMAKLSKLASPKEGNFVNASEQYYSLMYFVDKKYEEDVSTCTGKTVAKPMVNVSVDECAHACDQALDGGCVGFSHWSSMPDLCFLFSKFTEVKYYVGCDSNAFLQRRTRLQADPALIQCRAKLSKFEGTDLSPNVKCPGCLKKAEKANRCPSVLSR